MLPFRTECGCGLLRPFKTHCGPPEAVEKFNGRDALLRVRDDKPNTDAEHRVPTESRLYDQPNFSQLPSCKGAVFKSVARFIHTSTENDIASLRGTLLRSGWYSNEGAPTIDDNHKIS